MAQIASVEGGVQYAIECSNLRLRWARRKGFVLDGVSFQIRPGELVALLGPSGAGKSTLLHCIGGLERELAEGSIKLFGTDQRALKETDIRIGYLPQRSAVHDELRVIDELRATRDLACKETTVELESATEMANVLEELGLPKIASAQRFESLSGGERRRAEFAVTLMAGCRLFLLDEPTSGLDPNTVAKTMELFRRRAERGDTILMTTHSPIHLMEMCDRVMVLFGGRIRFNGSPVALANLMGNRKIQVLYTEKFWSECGASGEQNLEDASRKDPCGSPSGTQAAVLSDYHGDGRFVRRVADGIFRVWVLTKRELRTWFSARTIFSLAFQACALALLLKLASPQKKELIWVIVAMWLGMSISARTIVHDRHIYSRELLCRLVTPMSYLCSKMVSCLLVLVPLCVILSLVMDRGLEAGHVVALCLMGFAGILLGLVVSTCCTSERMALALIPLVLVPQLIFSVVSEDDGISKFAKTCEWPKNVSEVALSSLFFSLHGRNLLAGDHAWPTVMCVVPFVLAVIILGFGFHLGARNIHRIYLKPGVSPARAMKAVWKTRLGRLGLGLAAACILVILAILAFRPMSESEVKERLEKALVVTPLPWHEQGDVADCQSKLKEIQKKLPGEMECLIGDLRRAVEISEATPLERWWYARVGDDEGIPKEMLYYPEGSTCWRSFGQHVLLVAHKADVPKVWKSEWSLEFAYDIPDPNKDGNFEEAWVALAWWRDDKCPADKKSPGRDDRGSWEPIVIARIGPGNQKKSDLVVYTKDRLPQGRLEKLALFILCKEPAWQDRGKVRLQVPCAALEGKALMGGGCPPISLESERKSDAEPRVKITATITPVKLK